MVSRGYAQCTAEALATTGVAARHGEDKTIVGLMPSTQPENLLKIAVQDGVDSEIVTIPQVFLSAGSPWSPFDKLNPCVGAARILTSARLQFVFQP